MENEKARKQKKRHTSAASSMGRDAGVDAPSIDLDAYIDALNFSPSNASSSRVKDASAKAKDASNANVRVYRWSGDARVFLLAFRDAASQRRALGRVSMHLEDPDHRGGVPVALPSGARGGVANYSGHNARVRSVCAFFNLLRDADDAELWEDERMMMEALTAARLVRKEKDGKYIDVSSAGGGGGKGAWEYSEWYSDESTPQSEACVLAVCASGDVREVRDALLHEAMHGLWYARADFAEWCYGFYRSEALSDEERGIWVEFLRELRYDVSDEEVVVNEFQAYMATERQLFGPEAKGSNNKRSNSSSSASKSNAIDALTRMQEKFADAAKRDAVAGAPSVGSLRVVWETV
jgi:hypothetical protein